MIRVECKDWNSTRGWETRRSEDMKGNGTPGHVSNSTGGLIGNESGAASGSASIAPTLSNATKEEV